MKIVGESSADLSSPYYCRAHIDLAGPVWSDKEKLGTGYGAATLAHWAMSVSKKL